MVPVSALEATSNAFVGHQSGRFQALHAPGSVVEWRDVFCESPFVLAVPSPVGDLELTYGCFLVVAKPALVSAGIATTIEVPLCLILSFAAARPLARYLSGSEAVAAITARMWRTVDWVSSLCSAAWPYYRVSELAPAPSVTSCTPSPPVWPHSCSQPCPTGED